MLSTEKPNTPAGYWWLNATPKNWRFSDIAPGQEYGYSLYGERGNKRRIFQHFLSAMPGDMVICYASSPVRKVVSIARISRASDGENYILKSWRIFSPPD